MRGLYQLFAAYGNFLLFLALEGLSLVLLVQYNYRQKAIYDHSFLLLSSNAERQVDQMVDFINLRDEVLKLQGENQKLKQALESAKFSNAVQQDTVDNDSLEQLYIYTPANVIGNSINNTINYIRLDRGRNHGVAPNMGVVSANGIVGVVRAVSEHYSSVMSLLHRQTRIKAAVGSDGYFGTLRWTGKDPQYMQLEAIPKHAPVEVGDTVYTSGYSQLFPEGIMIGTVSEVKPPPGRNFYAIQVKLHNDLGKLRYVYVVNNLMREEHEELDETINE